MDKKKLKRLISAARGEIPCDLVLKGIHLVNVLSGEIHRADVGVLEDKIVGFGQYQAKEVLDAKGKYLCPGLIEAHIHIESSLLAPWEFSRLVSAHGTAAVVADPHELCNVLGIRGMDFFIRFSQDLPVTIYCLAPSCVPATSFETSGARLDAQDIELILQRYPDQVLGLAEVMNYPGVIFADDLVIDKLKLAQDRVIDGHCPALNGLDLNAYILAGPGSEHEAATLEEAREKLQKGMHIFVRQGSSAKNLKQLLPLINEFNAQHFSLATDDRHPDELHSKGHLDHLVRVAIKEGIPPLRAIQMASINTARYFGLKRQGAIAPGFQADFIILNDLPSFDIQDVYLKGRPLSNWEFKAHADQALLEAAQESIKPGDLNLERFAIPVPAGHAPATVKAIELVPGQILTRCKEARIPIKDNLAQADPAQDLAKLAVLERHQGSGRTGLGFVKGLGLNAGAMASSIAHDSHNLICAGLNDQDMLLACSVCQELKGGLVVARQGEVLGSLALPLGGLMSLRPWEEVLHDLKKIEYALNKICPGSTGIRPFMQLSFLALPVIPELRLTDLGLVDVTQFALTPLWTRP